MKIQTTAVSGVALGTPLGARLQGATSASSLSVAPLALDRMQLTQSLSAVPAVQSLDALAQRTPANWGDVSVAERQSNLQDLRDLALKFKSESLPGIEIWTQMTQAAIDKYAHKNISPQRQADFVMQDLAIVFNGPDAYRHLQSYSDLPWVFSPDDMVERFFDDWKTMGVPPADGDWKAVGYAGMGLDKHMGTSFRPRINDKTNNQIYHTFFYQFMGYVTQSPFNIRGGSMVHELRDAGTSSEDHNAMYVGMTTGMALRELRDQTADAGLSDWAAMTRVAYSPEGGKDIYHGTASERVQAHNQKIHALLYRPSILHRAENGLIDAYKGIKGFLGWKP